MLFFFGVGRPKRLLVFVNPFGGKKTARKIFLEEVKPLFDDAHVQLDVQGLLISVFGSELFSMEVII